MINLAMRFTSKTVTGFFALKLTGIIVFQYSELLPCQS